MLRAVGGALLSDKWAWLRFIQPIGHQWAGCFCWSRKAVRISGLLITFGNTEHKPRHTLADPGSDLRPIIHTQRDRRILTRDQPHMSTHTQAQIAIVCELIRHRNYDGKQRGSGSTRGVWDLF